MRDGDLLLYLLSSYYYANEPRGFVVPVNLTRGYREPCLPFHSCDQFPARTHIYKSTDWWKQCMCKNDFYNPSIPCGNNHLFWLEVSWDTVEHGVLTLVVRRRCSWRRPTCVAQCIPLWSSDVLTYAHRYQLFLSTWDAICFGQK